MKINQGGVRGYWSFAGREGFSEETSTGESKKQAVKPLNILGCGRSLRPGWPLRVQVYEKWLLRLGVQRTIVVQLAKYHDRKGTRTFDKMQQRMTTPAWIFGLLSHSGLLGTSLNDTEKFR